MEKFSDPDIPIDDTLHSHAADFGKGLHAILREVDEIKVIIIVDEGVAVADDLNRDEDVDCQQDGEGDQQEEQPAQLLLVFHRELLILL